MLFFVLGGLLVTLPLIFLTVRSYQDSKVAPTTEDTQKTAPLVIKPTLSAPVELKATLDFSPAYIDLSKEKIISTTPIKVDLILFSQVEKVLGAEIELSYDPNVYSQIQLLPSYEADSFFGEKVIITNFIQDQKNGKIYFSVQVPSNELSRNGRGRIAVLSFLSRKDGAVKSSKIRYETKSRAVKQTSTNKEFLPTGRVDLDILF